MIDLPDGRILFLPSGRSGKVYQVGTYEEGRRLDRWLRLIERLSAVLLLALLFALKFKVADPRYLLLGIPVVVLPFMGRRLLVTGLPELHDEGALRETDRGVERYRAARVEAPRPPENKPVVPR